MATDIFEHERLLNAPTRNFLAITALLSLAVVAGSLLPAGSAMHVPGYMVTLLGKYLTYSLLGLSVDLVWGFMGVLSLGHGAFFALGGYGFGMYLMRQIGARGGAVPLGEQCKIDSRPRGGLRIDIAVAHEQGSGRVGVDLLHQGVQPGRVGLGGHARTAAAHSIKAPSTEIVVDDLSTKSVRFVGKNGGLDALGLQRVQQFQDAGIGGRLVLLVGVVPGSEFSQRGRQLLRRAGIFRREALHQLRDAVAHHVLELFHRKGGPAVLCTHPVACIGKVVDGVQKGAVQIE